MIQKFKNVFHKGIAIGANIKNGFPASDLYVIGITGTDGKSTTAYYLYQILRENGKKVALISTTGAIIDGKHEDLGLHVTTPSPLTLQSLIKKAKVAECHYLVLEVTSHGIDQYRVWGIPFQIGILTNVTAEHLDYHKTLDNYAKTKIRLLKKSTTAIVGDDENGYVKKFLKGKDVTKYGLTTDAQINDKLFSLPKDVSDFNKKNMLGAIAAARYTGLTDKEIQNVLKNLKLPKARLDILQEKPYKIIIDFAHTPAAFDNLLPEVKKSTSNRLIHVFGSAGGRDQLKRKNMGEIASKFDDIIILTAEDPRNEDIQTINQQIKEGISEKQILEVTNRQEAIQQALNLAKPGDTVLLTGKGHEKSLNLKGVEHPWDEYEAVEAALRKI